MCTLRFPVESTDRIGNQYLESTPLPFPALLRAHECRGGSFDFRWIDFHGKVGEDVLPITNRSETLTRDFDRRVFRVVLRELKICEPQIRLSLKGSNRTYLDIPGIFKLF